MSDPNNGPADPVQPPVSPTEPPAAPPTAPPVTPPPTAPPVAPPVPPAYAAPGAYSQPGYTAPPAQPGGYAQPGAQPGGYAQPVYPQAGPPAATKTLSLIGMIAGIVGIIGSGIVVLPFVGSILGLFIPAGAIVLGFLGRKREGLPARTFWLTALITGFVGIGIALVALIGWIALFASSNSYDGY
ncbi:MAG: hypothetical protein H7146_09725 [Burkholderiaceae bacterium]|nr:hypothetical protein [Microbacteriaceae bacterium]